MGAGNVEHAELVRLSWSVSAPNRRIESLVGRGASANIPFVCVSGTNERAYEIAKAFDVEMRDLAGASLFLKRTM